MVIDAPGLHIIIKAGDAEYSTAVFVWPERGHEMQHFEFEMASEDESVDPFLRIDAAPKKPAAE